MSDSDLYRFTFVGNAVVAVEEFDDGRWEPERIERDEFYVRYGNAVIKTELERNGSVIEETRYEDSDGDGVFNQVSERVLDNPSLTGIGQIVQQGSERPFVIPGAFRGQGQSGNDVILLQNGVDVRGGTGSDSFVFRHQAKVSILDFNVTEGDRLVFDTGFGLQSSDDLAAYLLGIHQRSDNTVELDFGDHGLITLVGVNAQDLSWSLVDVLS